MSFEGSKAVSPLIRGGEMGQRVRNVDWSTTPLGVFSTWPQSLRSALSMVLNTKGIAALYWGPQQYLLYNDAYGAVLGNRHPWAFGRPMQEALPDIATVLGPQMVEVLATGQSFTIENVLIVMNRNGQDEETAWTYSFSPIQGEGDDFAGVLLLALETTKIRSAEVEQAGARRKQAILDSAVDFAIIATNRNGHVTDWNVGAERVLGWTADEMHGELVDRVFTSEDRAVDRMGIEMRLALEDDRASDERWHLRRNGNLFWSSGEMMPIYDLQDAHIGFLKILRDRTAEHQASKALREAEADLQRAQVAGGVGVFSMDVAENMLKVTPEFCRIFGIPVQDHIQPEEVECLVLPEDAHLSSSATTRVTGEVASDVEYRIRRADTGEIRWLSRRSEIERDGSGKPIRFFGVSRDITEQRLANDALARSEALARGNAQRVQLALAAGAIMGTWHWDLPTDRFTVDEGFAQNFSLDPNLGLEGLSLEQVIMTVQPDDKHGQATAINQAIARGGA